MLDASDLIDAIVDCLRTNSDLVQELAIAPNFDPDTGRIFAAYHDDPGPSSMTGSTNFEQLIQNQPRSTAMVAWRATRTGQFVKLEANKHDFQILIRPKGHGTKVFTKLMNGICTSPDGRPFRLSQVHPQVNLPENIQLSPQPTQLSNGLIYDLLPVTFTLTERGLGV